MAHISHQSNIPLRQELSPTEYAKFSTDFITMAVCLSNISPYLQKKHTGASPKKTFQHTHLFPLRSRVLILNGFNIISFPSNKLNTGNIIVQWKRFGSSMSIASVVFNKATISNTPSSCSSGSDMGTSKHSQRQYHYKLAPPPANLWMWLVFSSTR